MAQHKEHYGLSDRQGMNGTSLRTEAWRDLYEQQARDAAFLVHERLLEKGFGSDIACYDLKDATI